MGLETNLLYWAVEYGSKRYFLSHFCLLSAHEM